MNLKIINKSEPCPLDKFFIIAYNLILQVIFLFIHVFK